MDRESAAMPKPLVGYGSEPVSWTHARGILRTSLHLRDSREWCFHRGRLAVPREPLNLERSAPETQRKPLGYDNLRWHSGHVSTAIRSVWPKKPSARLCRGACEIHSDSVIKGGLGVLRGTPRPRFRS